ncbi:pentapeptide repeat-containing protein [Streptomyces sp. LP05-1]|uniref:Pentapeptide repeat-containing protein n=1 Tax=Streptomyces pyxinae TaxID=2970734 RepID=A0ABT2CFM2_9ACTN|nr:pentapeptide repeat-containing protein [Streptomyces sp. LP05-1]MCS0635882.1 pentapeptide repeat-containing protein [Streptomyces sp. LP05-1]
MGDVTRDEDWYGRTLGSEVRHEERTFYDTDWTEVLAEGAVFESCVFSGVRFNASRHEGAAYTNCVFRRCSFFDARFTGCKAVGSRFDDCTYGLLTVSGGDWSYTSWPGARLGKAVFEDVRLREADLTGARLDGAALTRCDLAGALLRGASLTGADLRGSTLPDLDPRTLAATRGARIDLAQAAALAAGLGFDVG